MRDLLRSRDAVEALLFPILLRQLRPTRIVLSSLACEHQRSRRALTSEAWTALGHSSLIRDCVSTP